MRERTQALPEPAPNAGDVRGFGGADVEPTDTAAVAAIAHASSIVGRVTAATNTVWISRRFILPQPCLAAYSKPLLVDLRASLAAATDKRKREANALAGSRRPSLPCPCCGVFSLAEPPTGTYEICEECGWEDDPVQFHDLDYRGGANSESLRRGTRQLRPARLGLSASLANAEDPLRTAAQ